MAHHFRRATNLPPDGFGDKKLLRTGKRQLSVYLPSEEYVLVQKEAGRRRSTMQQVLSEALRPFLNELRNRKAIDDEDAA